MIICLSDIFHTRKANITKFNIIGSLKQNRARLTFQGSSAIHNNQIRDKKFTKTIFHSFQNMHSSSSPSSSGTPNYNPHNYKYCYQWPRPSVTVDNIVFTVEENEVWLLLIKRLNEPFINAWALPGGFVDPNENLELAALRYV